MATRKYPPWYRPGSYVLFGGYANKCRIDVGVRWKDTSSLDLKFQQVPFANTDARSWDGIFGVKPGGDNASMMVRRNYTSRENFHVWNYSTSNVNFPYPFNSPAVLHVAITDP